jgi:TrmH family RNA methyltransferase
MAHFLFSSASLTFAAHSSHYNRMEPIKSSRNGRILRLVKLRKADMRRRLGLFSIEGERECQRALDNGINFVEIYVNGASADGKLANVLAGSHRIFLLDEHVFEKISLRENPDGIIALAQIPGTELPESLEANPLILLVESMEKPGNFGAIMRTADAVGCDLIIVVDALADIWSPNAIRASQGAIFSVPIASCGCDDALNFLRRNNIAIVGTGPRSQKCYWNSMPPGPLAIAIGNEHSGLSEFWLENADMCLGIPMSGSGSDSLNASTAAALFLYEALRLRSQRQFQ